MDYGCDLWAERSDCGFVGIEPGEELAALAYKIDEPYKKIVIWRD